MEETGINRNKVTYSPFLRQLLVCLISSSFFFMAGLSLGIPTVAVPQLRREANSTEAVSEEMATWITSIVGYAAVLGVILLTASAHIIGRKKTWFISAVCNSIGFILLYNSANITNLFWSQLCLGLVIGTQITVAIMVLTECSSPKYRGVFLTLRPASGVWGIWCANAIGTFFNYRYIGLLGIMCSVYNFCTTCIIPESPYWLAFKGRYEECAAAHRWLKGIDHDAEAELNTLINYQKNRKNMEKTKFSVSGCIKKYATLILEPVFYKPALLCILAINVHYLSGKIAFAVYAVEMMKKITSNESTAYTAMLILDAFSVLGMYICVYLAKIVKRKKQLLVFFAIATVLVFILSFYLYMVKRNVLRENPFITVGLLSVYSLAISCGPLMMAGTICGELYSLKNRSFFICCCGIFSKFLLGSILKLTPYLFKTIDCHGTFFFFGVISVVLILLVHTFIPETKDRTLHEIAASFETEKLDTELKLLKVKENELLSH